MKQLCTYTTSLIFIFILQTSFAQNKVKNLERYDNDPYHFGFMLGFNQMDFSMVRTPNYRLLDSLYTLETKANKGFNVGIVSNLRLGYFFDLRFIPSLYFGERSLMYSYLDGDDIISEEKKIESNILAFPLMLKYKSARLTNTRVYLIAGAQYTLDLASQSKKKELFGEENAMKLYRNDIMFETGIGFDFYLVYFKFATELKFAWGTKNILKQENTLYTSSIDKLHSQLMVISFTFE